MTSRRERQERTKNTAAGLLAQLRESGDRPLRESGVYAMSVSDLLGVAALLRPEDRCAAGRQLLREPDAPDLGADFTKPCPHPVTLTVDVAELDFPLGFCQCHFDALERSGALEDE